MSTEDAKVYLATREVPRLFECLMTGLMFHRPNDHLQYLIDSLEKVKVKGQASVTWNMFVDVQSAKRPLPPIAPDSHKAPVSRGHSKGLSSGDHSQIVQKEDAKPMTSARTTPLPPISSDGLAHGPVVFIMGGPCSGKSAQANKLAEKHPGWANVHLGELLRSEIHNKDAHDKWKAAKDLIVSGQLAPEDVTFKLLQQHIKNNTQADGFVIHGFPRNMDQVQLFENNIGRVDAVLLIDCGEEKLTNNSVSRAQKRERLDETPSAFAKRMLVFQDQTLPVLKHYDDRGKLYIVDGDQDEETIHNELSLLFEKLLHSLENGRLPTPPPGSRPSTGRWSRRSATPTAPPLSPLPPSPPASPADTKLTLHLPSVAFIPPPEIKVKDEGRKSELPTPPIIFLAGGPGSGKGTQCQKITARYPDIFHLSMGDIIRKEISEKGTADEKWAMIMKLLKQGDMAPVDVTEELLIRFIQDQPDAKAYLIEGYPRDALQYEQFNRNIGGHVFTILLDCESQYLHDRLVLRGGSGNDRIDDNIPAIEKKLTFFARNTLPLLKAIEDEQKLVVIDGDRDEEEVFYDLVKCLDFSLYGIELQEGKTSQEGDKDKTDGEEEEDEDRQMVEEEEFIAAAASTTGDNGGNPLYSSLLDSLEDPIVMIEMDVQEQFALEEDEEEGKSEEDGRRIADNRETNMEEDNIEANQEETEDEDVVEGAEETVSSARVTFEETDHTTEDAKETADKSGQLKEEEVETSGEANQTTIEEEVESSGDANQTTIEKEVETSGEANQTTIEKEVESSGDANQTTIEKEVETSGEANQTTIEKEVETSGEANQTTIEEEVETSGEANQTTIEEEQTADREKQTNDEVELPTADTEEKSHAVEEDDNLEPNDNIGYGDEATKKIDGENGSHKGEKAVKDDQEEEQDASASAEKLADSEREEDTDVAAEDDD